MLRKSKGQLEEGTAHSRFQRKQLRHSVNENIPNDLAFWRQEQPVVDHLLTFTNSLLETGGRRLKKLRFSSISTYLHSLLGPLIKNAWDADFSVMNTADYRTLYRAVELECHGKKTDWHLVLRMFHLHLRNIIGAPYLPELELNKTRMRKRCRSSLITSNALDMSLSLLERAPSISDEQRYSAKALLLTSIGYGGRQAECIGLKVGDFDTIQEKFLSVRPNVIRDLKNRTRGRVIPLPLLSRAQYKIISTQRKTAALSPDPEPFLFGSPKRNQKVIKLRPLTQSIINVLRASTGNEDVVFHDLRRTFATKLMMATMPLRSTDPALVQVQERLFGTNSLDRKSVSLITRSDPGNPFLIDSVAQLLGHSNVDTLLNVYFHGGPVLLADTAKAVNGNIQIDDGRLANMLGKDRTAIVQLRARRATNQESTDTASLIRYYLKKSSSINPKVRRVVLNENTPMIENISSKNITAVQLDRLLCHRKPEGISLSEMSSHALQLGIHPDHAQRVIENYRRMILLTGFDDFEPKESELLNTPPSRSGGVLRGRTEREAGLQFIAEEFNSNKRFAEDFLIVLRSWLEFVDARTPRLVCSELNSLNSTLSILSSLGVTDEQLNIEAVGSIQAPLIAAILKEHPSTRLKTTGKFSRGPANLRVTEVAITINQASKSKMPDGRDFHRLIAVATCVFIL